MIVDKLGYVFFHGWLEGLMGGGSGGPSSPGMASAAMTSISSSEKEFRYHYDHAYAFAKGVAQIQDVSTPKNLSEKKLRYEIFQYHLSQMERSGLDFMPKKDVDDEKAYLYRRLYSQCIKTAEGRLEKTNGVFFDFDRIILNDPDVQIAGKVYFQTHFKNQSQFTDDLSTLRENLKNKIRSPQAISMGLSEGNLSGAWKGILCYLGVC